MIIERVGNLIFNVCFKNSIVSITNASNIFLSDIGDSLKLNEKLNKILILKFNSYGIDCCKNGISHIKFLVKYSPVLSKIVDTSEFDSIEYRDNFFYMNGYLSEVNEQTGIWAKQLEGSGTFNLTGTQAVAFCRVRYAGLGDAGRTQNQRMIIEQCLKKVKSLILSKPTTVIQAVSGAMDSIATNLSMLELGNLAFQAGDFQIEESVSFPFQYTAGEYLGQIYEVTGGVKDAVVAKELSDNVIQLHAYLFPDAAYAYKLPEDVEKISEDIAWMSGIRKQEN